MIETFQPFGVGDVQSSSAMIVSLFPRLILAGRGARVKRFPWRARMGMLRT